MSPVCTQESRTPEGCEENQVTLRETPEYGQACAPRDGSTGALCPRILRAPVVGEWPELPSLRYLVYWALRREQRCDPGLCPDAPEGEHGRRDHCPLNRLNAAQLTDTGQLPRRTLELRSALAMGVPMGLDEVDADELFAMQVVKQERDAYDRERMRQEKLGTGSEPLQASPLSKTS